MDIIIGIIPPIIMFIMTHVRTAGQGLEGVYHLVPILVAHLLQDQVHQLEEQSHLPIHLVLLFHQEGQHILPQQDHPLQWVPVQVVLLHREVRLLLVVGDIDTKTLTETQYGKTSQILAGLLFVKSSL